MASIRWMLVTSICVSVALGCGVGLQDIGADLSAGVADELSMAGPDEPVRLPAAGDVLVAVTQPAVLAALEGRGSSLNAVMARGLRTTPASKVNAATMYAEASWYKPFVDEVARDIQQRGQALGGVYGAPPTNEARIFDYGYLRSIETVYDLVAIVGRVDRRDFYLTPSCGELRFVYRMKYKKSSATGALSRLPFSLNVVFVGADDGAGCQSYAKRWQVPNGIDTGEKYIDWVAKQPASLEGFGFGQIEVNVQANRLPSEAKASLGGAAEYFLRVYAANGNSLRLKPLENTPDVAKLRADAVLRSELISYLRSHLAEIDRGTFVLPEKFLATKATSVSTHGAYRMANRPFSQVLSAADLGFSAGDFANTQVVNSSAGVLARLDDASCAGCHQGASVAGFHVVGTENLTKVHPLNATRLATSPHFVADEPRRKAYTKNLIEGRTVNTVRPMSFLSARNTSGLHCTSGVNTGAFKQAYGCDTGLVCNDLERNAAVSVQFGTCMSATTAATRAGEPCVGGDHTSASDPSKDSLRKTGPLHPNCLDPIEGTPAGLVTRRCGPGFTAVANTAQAGEVCAYNGGAGFDACAASGDFSGCLGNADTFTRGLRGRCDESTPCRDDYICQRFFDISGTTAKPTALDLQAKAPRSPGFCVPTYFLFQMRVDGHAPSRTRWLD